MVADEIVSSVAMDDIADKVKITSKVDTIQLTNKQAGSSIYYLYNLRDFKLRVRHPLILTVKLPGYFSCKPDK